MIKSNQNPKVKKLHSLINSKKARNKENEFIIEGKKLLFEAPKKLIKELYVTDSFFDSNKDYLAELNLEVEAVVVSEDVMKYVCDMVTPQGILGVVSIEGKKEITYGEINIILEEIQDPGNMGTIIRTAEAVNANIFISKGSVDIYSPKIVRATMGSLFRAKIFNVDNIKELIMDMKNNNISVYAAHLKGDKYHYQIEYKKATCFLIGNEGSGLSDNISKLADGFIKIPIIGNAESLNVSIATGVLLYEALRQKMSYIN